MKNSPRTGEVNEQKAGIVEGCKLQIANQIVQPFVILKIIYVHHPPWASKY